MRNPFAVPTVPVALSSIALIVSVSGTAAAATAVIVTKIQQVAPHVIAGANAPKGDNETVVSRSMGSTDLHAGSVASSALASGSVTRAKLAANSVTGAKVAGGSLTASDLATAR